MILIGLGANLPHPDFGPPAASLEAALARLAQEGPSRGVELVARSPWYESAPWPPSDQPWYVNGAARLEGRASPGELLALLHEIEAAFGRRRGVANAARVLDLDLLDFAGLVSAPGEVPILPHPRIADRGFVLRPLLDLAPDWVHPASGRPGRALLAALGDLSAELRPLGAASDGT